MSVVPMQKVRLVVHVLDVDQALDIVQRSGALEFCAAEFDAHADTMLQFPHAELLPRVQHAVQFLEPYAPKKGLWRSLREGTTTELTEEEAAKRLSDTDAVASIVDDLERVQVEFADINETISVLTEKHTLLSAWKALPLKLSQLQTDRTKTLLVEDIRRTEKHPLAHSVQEIVTEHELIAELTVVDAKRVAITLLDVDTAVATLQTAVEAIDANIITLPEGVETPDVELVAVDEKLAEMKGKLALQHDQAEHFSISHYERLRVAGEVLSWQQDRYAVVDEAGSTANTLVFEGWLNATKRERIEQAFEKKGIAAAFAELELAEGEEPPVDIQNSPFVKPFEAVTRLYGMPGYTDLDPTVFLAGFFFLFFGLSLTDVGYGLALVLASVFILTLCKVTKPTRQFAKLLLFIGTSTVFVGMLFGGYLGFDPSNLPEPLQKIQMFNPIADPLPVFYLALGLGVFQVMVGMALKIYSEARNGRLLDGVFDQGPWLTMFGIGILYLFTTLEYVAIVSTDVLGNLALVTAVVIFLASGRNGDGVVGKIVSAFAGLYAGVGHFSDILSYSRLLALGLATSALAFAVNLIADMVSGTPYVGFLLAGAILLVGHLFTLAINTLGAFVHSARLQFVEFFGKFITGTGKEFAPLHRKKRYITIDDD